MAFKYPDRCRIAGMPGQPGQFRINSGPDVVFIQASAEMGWEHVSVSLRKKRGSSFARTPTWYQMCEVKRLFWDETDLVIQYHPPESDYINKHPGVLHLWRKAGTNDFVETPSKWMV